jgi:hypothetical protein
MLFSMSVTVGCVAAHAEFVSVRIAEVGAIVVRVVVGPEARRAVAGAAVGQRGGVRAVHGGAVGGQQRHHLAVADRGCMAVEGRADQEQGARRIGALPAGPWLGVVAKAQLQAQFAHERRVETEGALEVVHADENMGQHAGGFLLVR